MAKQIIYNFLEVGSTVDIPVSIKPELDAVANNVEITISHDVKLTYDSSTLDIGTYDDGTKIWSIATLPASGTINGTFTFLVANTDDLAADGSPGNPIEVTFTLDDSNFSDRCGDDNVLTAEVMATPCDAISECYNNTFPLPTEFVQSDDDVANIAAGTFNKVIYNSFNILQGFVLADGTKIIVPLTNVEQTDGQSDGTSTTGGDLVDGA